jgi:4-hydroxybenzoyl-CoA thioesterase
MTNDQTPPPPSLAFVEGQLIDRRTLRVEWGDCDPAGIVFHPRFIAFFDASTHELFHRALGMNKPAWRKHYNVMGTPIVDLRTRFLRPVTYGDDITIESQINSWGKSSFTVAHRLLKSDALCVEAAGTRIWTGFDTSRPGGIKAVPIPADVMEKFRIG